MNGKHIAFGAIGLSAFALCAVAALAYDILRQPDACRVQVLTSEERIRDAVAMANKAQGDKMAALIKGLGVAP